MDHFYMYVTSNSCDWLYPSNKGNEFTIELPKQVHLPGNWEVAISELKVVGDLKGKDFFVKSDLVRSDPLYQDSILRRVWLKNKSRGFQTTYAIPFYVPLNHREIKRFTVSLETTSSSSVPVNSCELTLHFRKCLIN